MIRPRPFTLVLAGLAIAGALRTGTAIFFPDRPDDLALFGAAQAAGGTEETAQAAPPAPVLVCETPEDILQDLSEERDLLGTQKERLAERESEISLAAEKLGIEQGRLTELKTEVEALLAKVKQAQSDDLNRLVALYSAMKPKEAAAILNDMDIETSVLVLATMPERDAAPIMAQLNRIRARAISRIILERSKLPGDQRLEGLKL